MRMAAAVLTLAVVMALVLACGGGAAPAPTAPPPAQATPTSPAGGETPAPSPGNGGGDMVEVNLEDPGGSGAYAFDPSEFNFSVGDTVTFQLDSETEFHTFTVDALGIDEEVDAGETVTMTYTFDEAGTFDLICIPHEFQGMTGAITVE